MSTNKTFKILSISSVLLFLAGIIFSFINFPVGLTFFIFCFGINFYIQKNFPDNFKKIIEENKFTSKTKPLKENKGKNIKDV